MQGMTRDKVVAAHQRLVRSDRVVIIAGPVQVEDMPAKLKPLASGLPAPSFNNWLPQAHARERAAVVGANAEAVQTAFRISLPCVAYDHPDFSAVQLVTNLLGGFSLARLFSILREEKGYTYGAYAQPSVRPHAQTIDLVTSVGNEHTADTVRILAEQVQRMGSELIPADELEDARQQLLGSFARTNETPQQTASLVWQTIQHGLPLDYFERHVSRLQSYRPEELLSVQQRYFDVNRWAVGCSGLPEVLQPALEPYVDSIEIWDASDQDAGDQETGDPETGEAANDA
jgi:predicted Zn-dependent peptidase